jgi:hypothetical protein
MGNSDNPILMKSLYLNLDKVMKSLSGFLQSDTEDVDGQQEQKN